MTKTLTIEEHRRVCAERAERARYVVMVGDEPYTSTLGLYDDGFRQWNPVRDGGSMDLSLCGIATMEEAVRECEAAYARVVAEVGPMAARPFVVELPGIARVYTAGAVAR